MLKTKSEANGLYLIQKDTGSNLWTKTLKADVMDRFPMSGGSVQRLDMLSRDADDIKRPP